MININETLFIVLLLIIVVASWFFIPPFLNRRAAKQVVRILTKANCFTSETAKTPRSLGLVDRGWIANLGRSRDYKPRALQTLIELEIVQKTDDDRVFLVKEKLALYNIG